MSTGNIPLNPVIADQLITSALWNAEFANLQTLTAPEGIEGYEDTDSEMQIQTAPFPGSVTSHATSLAGELERIRYQLNKIIGKTYWYEAPDSDIKTMENSLIPVGACIDYPTNAAPNTNFHLADGTAISRAGFPALFALIGTTFGVGNGTTTFNIPDYRDRMSIGAGNLYAGAATGGSASGAVSVTDPGHNHTQNSHTHTMANHTHSTPSHTHVLDYLLGAAGAGNVAIPGNAGSPLLSGIGVFTNDAANADAPNVDGGDGARLSQTYNAGGTSNKIRTHLNKTQNSGSGTSGAPSTNTSDATTPTNNSNTTGITAAVTTPLPPYLAMFKMIRVL